MPPKRPAPRTSRTVRKKPTPPPKRRSNVKKAAKKPTRKVAPTAPAEPEEEQIPATHVLNGHTVLELWGAAGLKGTPVVHGEAWSDGPLHRDLDVIASERVGWLSAQPGVSPEKAAQAPAFLEALKTFAQGDTLVLWGEADLFCLVNLLGAYSLVAPEAADVAIVWSETPIAPQGADRVRELTQRPRRLGSIDGRVLRRAWEAYADPDLHAIRAWIGDPRLETILPGAGALFRQHLARLPAKKTGLGDDEDFVLRCVVDGATELTAIMSAVAADPDMARYGYGDLDVLRLLHGMARSDRPLVRIKKAEGAPLGVSLQPARDARAVLAGRVDRLRISGIDRWIGALHVTKKDAREARTMRPE